MIKIKNYSECWFNLFNLKFFAIAMCFAKQVLPSIVRNGNQILYLFYIFIHFLVYNNVIIITQNTFVYIHQRYCLANIVNNLFLRRFAASRRILILLFELISNCDIKCMAFCFRSSSPRRV